MNSKQIIDFLDNFDYDIKKSNNARFTDQKVTADVLSSVSECIIEFIGDNIDKEFTINEIRYSTHANEIVTQVFSKPDISQAENEYDKFFSQPIKMLAYANILDENSQSHPLKFKVNNFNILNYIAIRERNALNFITLYLEKVLNDSGLINSFDNFFEQQTATSFNALKDKYVEFIIKYTAINKPTEPKRIFTKVINPLALKRRKFGTRKGRISNTIISLDEVLYNRPNWRDLNKDKSITRQQFLQSFDSQLDNSRYYKYSIEKAKKFVKKIHEYSEIHRFESYIATQAHHIFPQNEYPEIADFPENIIAITPNQHFSRAHPNNKTAQIDFNYQLICLISKLDSIETNYMQQKEDYSKDDFVSVLNIGYETDFFTKTMSFEEIKHQITNIHIEKIIR